MIKQAEFDRAIKLKNGGDINGAMKILERLVEDGNADAARELAYIFGYHLHRTGLKAWFGSDRKNSEQARYYTEKGAALGDACCRWNLADTAYKKGDYLTAYNISAKSYDEYVVINPFIINCINLLSLIYYKGLSVNKDIDMALVLFRLQDSLRLLYSLTNAKWQGNYTKYISHIDAPERTDPIVVSSEIIRLLTQGERLLKLNEIRERLENLDHSSRTS